MKKPWTPLDVEPGMRQIDCALQPLFPDEKVRAKITQHIFKQYRRFKEVVHDDSGLLQFEEKIGTLIALLKEKGVTLHRKDFLDAAVRGPNLLTPAPVTVMERLEEAVALYQSRGIDVTLQSYVNAALKNPALFWTSGKTIMGNIDNIVSYLESLEVPTTVAHYFDAAMKCPVTFSRSSRAVIHGFEWAFRLHDKGYIRLQGHEETTRQDVVENLLKSPLPLGWATSNFVLREYYGDISDLANPSHPNHNTRTNLLRLTRGRVAKDICAELGYSDLTKLPEQPVIFDLDVLQIRPRMTAGEHKHLERAMKDGLLRGLIAEGLINIPEKSR